MDSENAHDQAVQGLEHLGLKEYEAKSFVALTRLPSGTAEDISKISDVPRTRVYDAVRVLEAKGLVEVQHSNPSSFAPSRSTRRSPYSKTSTNLASRRSRNL